MIREAHPEAGSGHCWHFQNSGAGYCCLCMAREQAKLERDRQRFEGKP